MNPELQRHLWLELSGHRLVAMPCVLLLLFLLVALSPSTWEPTRLTSVGVALFFILAVGWGAQRVSAAVLEEWRERTWDQQRMSALGPWAMTWGKLFGSTVFAWYGAGLCLLVVALTWPPTWSVSLGTALLGMISAAIGVQAVALLSALIAARKGWMRARWFGLLAIPLLLILSGVATRVAMLFDQRLLWWGTAYSTWPFVLGSTLVWAVWAVCGAYRLMCQELQVRTTPWLWASFLLFLAWYLAGFLGATILPNGFWTFVLTCGAVAGALTYGTLFTEQTGVLVIRRVWVRVQRREWRRACEALPCWPVSLIVTVLCGLLWLGSPPLQGDTVQAMRLGPPLVVLLLIRDVAIFLGFMLSPAPRRAEATTLLYLGLLYLVLPNIGLALGSPPIKMFFLPPIPTQPWVAAAILLGHVSIALVFLAYRWRQSTGRTGR